MKASTMQRARQEGKPRNRKSYNDALGKDEDTQEAASFLLSLKHRSVTPEPNSTDSESSQPPTQFQAAKSAARSAYAPSTAQSHGYEDAATPCADRACSSAATPSNGDDLADLGLDWEAIVAESKLVYLKDRDLVPDALFVAMAQMKPCRLTHADRVGCYKAREIGFIGMCCKHCGGHPGFGRYYPNSVRSLAQTTTSQTILKHVGGKCRFCPPAIRDAVVELQRQQAIREGMPSGRPRYGSRKIFFQRVWARLHGGKMAKELEEDDSKFLGDSSSQMQSDFDEDRSMASETTDGSSLVAEHLPDKRKLARLGTPPAVKDKRRKISDSHYHALTAE